MFALSAVSFVFFVLLRTKKRSSAPCETEQSEVDAPKLSAKEKARGFFSVGMIIYIVYCVAMSVYYIYLSFK